MRAANYSAVNAFLQNFNEGIGMELKKYSIDVLSVCPDRLTLDLKKPQMKFLVSSSAKTVANAAVKSLGKNQQFFRYSSKSFTTLFIVFFPKAK